MCWVHCSLVIAGLFHFPFRVGTLDLARVPVCVCVCVCVCARCFTYILLAACLDRVELDLLACVGIFLGARYARYFPPRKGKRLDWEPNPKVVISHSQNL